MSHYIYKCWVIGILILNLMGCDSGTERSGDKPLVVATTGMIADAVRQVADSLVDVIGLMGPGVDPHLYKATQNDLSLLRQADIIFYNGLHLEGKMGEILEKLSRQKPVYAVGESIPKNELILTDPGSETYDPHIWFDLKLWQYVVKDIETKLASHLPQDEEVIHNQATSYLDTLENLDNYVMNNIQTIPEAQRVMITAHDAFEYFGKAYGIDVKGLQGISTVAEFGLKDIREMVDLIVQRNIKAVFVETSVPSKSLEAVVAGCKQKGYEVLIGGTLYSDAMGAKNTPEGTYTGMVKSNVLTVVEGLK